MFKLKKHKNWGAWLAESVEHVTLDLGVLSASPMLGAELACMHACVNE